VRENVTASFKALSQHVAEETEECHESLIQSDRHSCIDSDRELFDSCTVFTKQSAGVRITNISEIYIKLKGVLYPFRVDSFTI
jgi:hypothetical protein